MSKDSRKQIIEQTRNEVSRRYTVAIEQYKQELTRVHEAFAKCKERVLELEEENVQLRDKVSLLEDWNRRLMEYMDIDENQRQQELDIQRQRAENEITQARIFNSPLIRMAERLF